MEALEAIYTRRSIRQFTDQPVEAEKIESLLRAAMQAPSAHNKQPWHFLIINDRSLLNQIADFHPYAKMLYKAPLALAVCGDLGKESNDRYLALNCAAATQNILLAAHGLNLGAVWIAVYPREERIKRSNFFWNYLYTSFPSVWWLLVTRPKKSTRKTVTILKSTC